MITTDLIDIRPVGRCRGAGCTSILLAQDVWGRFTHTDRRKLAVAFASNKGRSLCTRCYRRAAAAGDLIDYEPRHMASRHRADEHAHMRGELPSGASDRRRLQAGAARQGCHSDTLRRALRVTGESA